MVKVLIYSSKAIYDTASYEGRAEADIIAYSIDEYSYQLVKNRHPSRFAPFVSRKDLEKYGTTQKHLIKRHIEQLEKIEINET